MPTARDLRNISEKLLQAGSTLNRTSKLIEAAEGTTKKFSWQDPKRNFISATWENGALTTCLVARDTSGYRSEFPPDLHPGVYPTKLPKEVAAFLRAEATNLINEATAEIQTKVSVIQNSAKGFKSAGDATKRAAECVRQAAILEETATLCDAEKVSVRIEGGGDGRECRPITSVCIKAKHVGHIILNGRDHGEWGIQGACVEVKEYGKQDEPCCSRHVEKRDLITVSLHPLGYYSGELRGKPHPFVTKLCKWVSEEMQREILMLQGATGPITYQLTSAK